MEPMHSLANLILQYNANSASRITPGVCLGNSAAVAALPMLYTHQMANRLASDNRLLAPRLDAACLEHSLKTIHKSSDFKVTLDENDLWKRFDSYGTEMIVTRSGRRMFPILKVKVEGLDPDRKYCVMLQIIPSDDCRYKFCNGSWTVSGRAEPFFTNAPFIHPDGMATEGDDYTVNWSTAQTFVFPETRFFAVTAYQNENITQLKIDNNPFAKGFRDREKVFPQKRCTPFLEQLREAATSDAKCPKSESDDRQESPEKKSASLSTIKTTMDILNYHYYEKTKFDLLKSHGHQHQQYMHNTHSSMPLINMSMERLPLMNFHFGLAPDRPGT